MTSSSDGIGRACPGLRSRRWGWAVGAARGALALGLACGCGPSAEQREAHALLDAADALRDAPSEPIEARRALLTALSQKPAASPGAAAAREACVRAYTLLLDTQATEARVRRLLSSPGTPGTAALSDLAELAAAEVKVKESAQAMPACDTALADLRRAARRGR